MSSFEIFSPSISTSVNQGVDTHGAFPAIIEGDDISVILNVISLIFYKISLIK